MYRTYYVHIEKINGKLWKDHILFRNYLRINKEVVKEYSELKEKLAKKYKNDRITYTIEKIPFIQRIIKKLKKKVYL